MRINGPLDPGAAVLPPMAVCCHTPPASGRGWGVGSGGLPCLLGLRGLAADTRVSGVCPVCPAPRGRKGKDSNCDDRGRTWRKLPTILDTKKKSVISSLF